MNVAPVALLPYCHLRLRIYALDDLVLSGNGFRKVPGPSDAFPDAFPCIAAVKFPVIHPKNREFRFSGTGRLRIYTSDEFTLGVTQIHRGSPQDLFRGQDDVKKLIWPSVITLKPAIRYQFKTGQWDWPKT
jgi:hypothetical protein